MQIYKLIQDYPNSPEINSVAIEKAETNLFEIFNSDGFETDETILYENIIKYPKHWVKIYSNVNNKVFKLSGIINLDKTEMKLLHLLVTKKIR